MVDNLVLDFEADRYYRFKCKDEKAFAMQVAQWYCDRYPDLVLDTLRDRFSLSIIPMSEIVTIGDNDETKNRT